MSDRWTGTWLSGPGSASGPGEDPPKWPGEGMGLPEAGPGSVAGRGARLAAFVLDLVVASLLTSLFVEVDVARPEVMSTFNAWAVLVWFLVSAGAVSVFGFTPGMFALGVRVVRVDGTQFVGPLRAVVRTAMTAVILPAALIDANGRGLHDRAVGTVVVRTR
ncbi:RDD family protein [Actinophytocola xanthii]|uniref:RDD family protein n=1 Tax=Actinophytocola xanthii TaxID=1912961 RepID=UPI001E3EBF9C|nr:RDD family protein [Actinophytocola xanthii]